MIPYAILSGDVLFDDNSHIEIRILELSSDAFTFRLSKKHDEKVIKEIRLSFYSFEKCARNEITLVTEKDFEVETLNFDSLDEKSQILNDITDLKTSQKTEYSFFTMKRVLLKNTKSEEYVNLLTKEYLTYIQLKLAGDDGALSKELAGYPSDLDQVFPETVSEWRKECFKDIRGSWNLKDFSGFALNLNSPSLLKGFLDMSFEQFLCHLEHTYYIGKIPLSEMKISSIYIGNQFDAKLLPDIDTTGRVLKKARQLGLEVIFQFPPMKDRQVEHFTRYLSLFEEGTELVVNDYGLCELIRSVRPDYFSLTLGILLNKRRKDVRLPYKKGIEKELATLSKNGLNAEFYQKELAERYQIRKYSYESCGYPMIAGGDGSVLHVPYYQMNTGGMADLNEDDYVFYPSHLHMIGKGNSLFGFDTKIFSDEEYLRGYLEQKPSRIVFEFI